jgi:hypothetical protein
LAPQFFDFHLDQIALHHAEGNHTKR